MPKLSARKITLLTSVLFFIWLFNYLFLENIPSVDLPGHIALIDSLKEQILLGNIEFFDPMQFTGYPAFSFYGFLAHLVTAVFCITLNFWFNLSTDQSVAIITVSLLSLLPCSIFYLCRAITLKPIGKQSVEEPMLPWLAAWSGTLSFVFLNLDFPELGAGLNSIIHTGLFTQLFAWHLLLISVALAVKIVKRRSILTATILTITLSGLIITHPLTAIYCFAIIGLLYLFHLKNWQLIIPLATAAVVTSFWWQQSIIFLDYQNNDPSLHSYRIIGLTILMLVPITACLLYRSIKIQKFQVPLKVISLCCMILLTVFSATNPPGEYSYSKSNAAQIRFFNEVCIVDYLKKSPPSGRVAVEYLNDYELFDFVAPHFLPAQLARNNIPSLNGLLIQSSNIPIFSSLAAKNIGIDNYGPSAFFYQEKPDFDYALSLYKSLGVSHLIISNPHLARKIYQKKKLKIKFFGALALVELPRPEMLLATTNKPILNITSDKQIRHKYLQYYLLSKPDLQRNVELIQTNNPPKSPQLQSIGLKLTNNISKDSDFPRLVETMDKLDWSKLRVSATSPAKKERLVISPDNQTITLTGLTPGQWYRLNYSFLPMWQAKGGKIYRGQLDRIILFAEEETAVLSFH